MQIELGNWMVDLRNFPWHRCELCERAVRVTKNRMRGSKMSVMEMTEDTSESGEVIFKETIVKSI